MDDALWSLVNVFSWSVFIVLIVEFVLSATWNRFYFTVGLPVFVKNVSATPQRTLPPEASEMEAQFPAASSGLALAFKALSQNEYGFRERLFEFRLFGLRYVPIMHGLLVYDYAQQQVVVKGFANWTLIGFALVWLISIVRIGSISFAPWLSAGFFALAVLVIYAIQMKKYRRVASVAAALWLTRGTQEIPAA